jgi:hypothetical protein
MWLKVHYPAEFYTASLMKAETTEKGRAITIQLLKDAARHDVKFAPPDPGSSGLTWTLDTGRKVIRAGFSQIPGVGDVTALAIVAARAKELDETGRLWDSWQDLLKAKGVGPVTMEKIAAWADREDPFGVFRAARVCDEIKNDIRAGNLNIPMPTHGSDDMQNVSWDVNKARERRVVFVGIVRQRDYKDILEDQRARSGEEIEDIKKRLKRPDLVKFATLRCYDDGSGTEEVYLRFNRFHYRKFQAQIDGIEVGQDAVVAVGKETKGFGAAIQVDRLYVISPDN